MAMKLKLLFFITFFTLLLFNIAHAQTPAGKISGSVLDEAKKPLDGATVILLIAKDSTVVSSQLVGQDGSFAFANLKDNTYLVKATFIGYKNFLSGNVALAGQQGVVLPAFVMAPAGKTLSAVSVTAKKSFIEQKIDRTVVNVGALISNTGTNALEVLQKTPGVQVDADGNITFKGKSGVLVMIDDKPTYLSATQLVTYLKSLPASSLDQIELMDNPPAKYDAAGNAGVINIKTKKNTIKGFHAVLGGDYAQGFYGRNSENINMNYRVNKVNLFANLGYDEQRSWRRLEIDRDYLDANGNTTSSLKDISYFRPTSYNANIKAGMDFYASPKTTWGIVYTGTIERDHDNSPVYSLLYGQNAALDSTITTLNTSQNKFNSNGININYTHKFDSLGRELTFDLDYIRDASNSNQQFVNDTYLPDGTLTNTTMLTDNLPAYIDIYSAKADYAHPLPGKAKFEAGIKSSYVNTDNAANYFNVVNGVSSIDYNSTNRFLYKENINAAYVNFNKNWGRFAIQTGLRAENTNGDGHQLGNAERADSSFINHYTNLFPTAYLSYNLDTAGHHVLVASYGRRIGRPNYGSLNPFTFFVDEFTQFTGNPFLRPQFTDNYKLAYSYRSLFTVAVAYNYTTDVQGETIHRDSDVFISTQGNIGMQKTLDFSVTTNFSPTKWWTVNLYAEVYKNTYQGAFYTGYLNQSEITVSGNGNNQFAISPTWSAELSGFFDTGGTYGQFVTLPKGMLNAAIQKKILNNKGSLKLTAQNMLQSFSPSGTITNIVDARAKFHNTLDTRVVTLAFTYSFGQSNNIPQKRETGGADSEQGRAH
jgi:hypothetical protein